VATAALTACCSFEGGYVEGGSVKEGSIEGGSVVIESIASAAGTWWSCLQALECAWSSCQLTSAWPSVLSVDNILPDHVGIAWRHHVGEEAAFFFRFPLEMSTNVVAGHTILGEDSDVQNRLLILDLEDSRIGKFIVGNELLNTIPIDKVALLSHFLC
jgi:hypothetical protein